MSNSQSTSAITFFAQSAILADYAYQSDPKSDPIALKVILDVLRKGGDLRREFFRLSPNAAWIPVLWEEGFFDRLPDPQLTNEGVQWFYSWDVQLFLANNAAAMPLYLLRHIKQLEELGASAALREIPFRALALLLDEQKAFFDQALPFVLPWLEDSTLATVLMDAAFSLIGELARRNQEEAFAVLFALLTPHRNPNAKTLKSGTYMYNAESISCLGSSGEYHLENDEEFASVLESLRRLNFERFRSVWEQRLLETLHVESITRGHDEEKIGDSTWWRKAIEDTDQDILNGYKHLLLVSLRDTLEAQGHENFSVIRPHIERYLQHERQILRRVGLHLLRVFSSKCVTLVEQELIQAHNYADSAIHHEFFELLASGFPHLAPSSQRRVLDIITAGPSEEYLNHAVEWGLSVRPGSPEELRKMYLEVWQRDRLWMIRDALPDPEATVFAEMMTRLQQPDHPTFTSYMSSAFAVESVSPISREQMRGMSFEQIKDLLISWQPNPDHSLNEQEVNWEGLSSEIASFLKGDWPIYSNWVIPIALLRPILALAIINNTLAIEQTEEARPATKGIFRGTRRRGRRRVLQDRSLLQEVAPSVEPAQETVSPEAQSEIQTTAEILKPEPSSELPEEMWEIRLKLVEAILADPNLRQDTEHLFTGGWSRVRLDLVNLLKKGLQTEDERQVPDALLPRVRDAFLAFCDDPDPQSHHDHLPEDHFGHDDPITTALNHVRSEAVSALITYASTRVQRGLSGQPMRGVGPSRLEPEVVAAFQKRMDRSVETSRAVRAVFGIHLGGLHWLDQKWVEAHLEAIFPLGDTPEDWWYFSGAWDAYLVGNSQLSRPLLDTMRPFYVRGVEAVKRGHSTSTYLETNKRFAAHLFTEYFDTQYDLRAPAGEKNLLRLWIENATPKARGEAAWVLWRSVGTSTGEPEEDLEDVPPAKVWQCARAYWQWRADVATQNGHSGDYDEEMQWLILLANLAPKSEPIASLYPLLSASIAQLKPDGRHFHLRDDLEALIVEEVEADPLTCIRLYSLLLSNLESPFWLRSDAAQTILSITAAHTASRTQTLQLINRLARDGVTQFNDIYNHWSKHMVKGLAMEENDESSGPAKPQSASGASPTSQ